MKAWKWLTENKPSNLLTIVLAVVAALGAYFGSVSTNYKNLQILKQTQTQNLFLPQPTVLSTNDTDGSKQNNDSYDNQKWVYTKGTTPNNEGYYCPQNIGFPTWAMWTKNKYKSDAEVSVTFSLQDKTEDKKNPTLYFSFGDKTSSAPDTFYRLNVFDGDLNTLRLYNRGDNEVIFERSVNEASLDQFITLKISPVFPNKKSTILLLNPTVSFQVDGQQYDFSPKNDFKIKLPFPSVESQGDGFQFGIGISRGDCFKIVTTSL
jgi:hypothetical protein